MPKLVRNVPLALVRIAVPTVMIPCASVAQHGALSSHVSPEPEVQLHTSQILLAPRQQALVELIDINSLVPNPQKRTPIVRAEHDASC